MLLHYDDILTFDIKELFTKHFLATSRCANLDEFKKKKQALNFSPETKMKISDCYKLLRANNWFPVGARNGPNDKLEIRWARLLNFVPPEKEEILPDWQDSRSLSVKAKRDSKRIEILREISSGEISYEEGTKQIEALL